MARTLSEHDFPELQDVDGLLAIAASQAQLMLEAARKIVGETDYVGGAPEHIIAVAQLIATNRARLSK